MKRLVSIFLLTVSAVLLIVGLVSDHMRTKGIVTVKFDLPRLHDPRWTSDHVKVPNPDLSDLTRPADAVRSIAADVATRVSEGLSQATDSLSAGIDGINKPLTVGTDQICHGSEACRAFPSHVSGWLPSSLDTILDLPSGKEIFSAVPKFRLRTCLITALTGVVGFALILAGLLLAETGTLGILSWLTGYKLVVLGVSIVVVIVPLCFASAASFSVPILLRKIDVLEVENGPFLGCLGAVLGLVAAAICCSLL